MEDKRIRKTKKNLKSTLIKMLSELSFSQISITELCKSSRKSWGIFKYCRKEEGK